MSTQSSGVRDVRDEVMRSSLITDWHYRSSLDKAGGPLSSYHVHQRQSVISGVSGAASVLQSAVWPGGLCGSEGVTVVLCPDIYYLHNITHHHTGTPGSEQCQNTNIGICFALGCYGLVTSCVE